MMYTRREAEWWAELIRLERMDEMDEGVDGGEVTNGLSLYRQDTDVVMWSSS